MSESCIVSRLRGIARSRLSGVEFRNQRADRILEDAADLLERYRDAEVMRGRAWDIARKLDAATPRKYAPGFGSSIARTLNATATDDGITIEMQCGATILAVHLSPDEWDDFRAEGDDARDAFVAGALEDPDHDHDLDR